MNRRECLSQSRLLIGALLAAALTLVVPLVLAANALPAQSSDESQNRSEQKKQAESEQQDQPAQNDAGKKAAERPIQDNSFLVEEAYNQEYSVVQHISTFMRTWNNKDWIYTFTQEWPVNPRPRHQLSYTIPLLHAGDFRGSGAGIGDIALNYRYQVFGNGDTRVAFAPRLSLLIQSGSTAKGRGAGSAGVQTNLPVSVVLSERLVTHLNAGLTVFPSARDDAGNKARSVGYNFGQSFIWLAHPRFNVMLETVWSGALEVIGPSRTKWSDSFFLNPGIRWAHNFASGLQIVPGIAIPVGVGPSAGQRGVFLYLSFEHPFGKGKK